ncbi:hypothetical protein [Rhizobium phage RHph_X2_24]|nr:hypothetical protein [Rhizobium phage RHph_X2_24]
MSHSRRSIFSATAFANGAAAAATTPAPAAAAKKAGAPKAEDRIAPAFGSVRTDIPVPAAAKRGSKSELAEKLDALPVNGSIGIGNKTKKQISSQLSKINNAESNMRPKVDAAGNAVTKPGEPIKDANGAVVGHGPAVAEMEQVKEFKAFDVDAKTDPDKATVRIFRIR